MVARIGGKTAPTSIKHLKLNNNVITDHSTIANTLGQTFAQNSSINQYTPKFQQFKKLVEAKHLQFNSKNEEPYNKIFSLGELKEALHCVSDSSPGPDNIHYQFLKHLPQSSLILLLNIFNNLWTVGVFPAGWP